jgi:glycosyltransferase involved in cell wall biosynthesis
LRLLLDSSGIYSTEGKGGQNMTTDEDYCCLACADGEWNSNANPRLKPADIGSIILHSPKKCLADYIARIKHQRDDARYRADQENRLRLQAESRCDRLLWTLEDLKNA